MPEGAVVIEGLGQNHSTESGKEWEGMGEIPPSLYSSFPTSAGTSQ